MSNRREFSILFEKAAISQRRLAELLGVTPITVNRWLIDRDDHVDPPHYAMNFLRAYLMLTPSARAHLPLARKPAKAE